MTIIYGQVEGLYKALEDLKKQPQSFTVARKLKDVFDAVNKEREFCSQQVKGLVETYGKKDEKGALLVNESGGYCLEDGAAFSEKFGELLSTNTGEIPALSEEMLKNFTISAEQLDSLMLIMEVSSDG